ncbi:DUF397 domain-containing protein [Streptomyces sp. NPDC005774]|uniref:DUF397 domain-containing protein n=1 Tax=Streptomyces sp. NPDC005774 TaxID=3364728 RepID=UPI00369214F4
MPAFIWQKSSYCGEGDSCVHVATTAPSLINWQKSSYCPEGNSCVHVATTARSIHITESADPSGAILTTNPDRFLTLIQAIKVGEELTGSRRPGIEVLIDAGDDTVRIRATAAPGTTVTTDRRRWDAFVLGVRAGEFDHFVAWS